MLSSLIRADIEKSVPNSRVGKAILLFVPLNTKAPPETVTLLKVPAEYEDEFVASMWIEGVGVEACASSATVKGWIATNNERISVLTLNSSRNFFRKINAPPQEKSRRKVYSFEEEIRTCPARDDCNEANKMNLMDLFKPKLVD